MAVNTITASDITAQPRLSHEGLTTVRATANVGGASTTLSDIYLMCKLPSHVWVIDGYLSGTHAVTASTFKVGISGDDNAFLTLASISGTSQVTRFNGDTLPYKVSLSDSANPQWIYCFATMIAGSSTLTSSINLVIQYAKTGAVT